MQMQLNIKLVAAIVVVTVGGVAGIYTISTKQVEQPKPGTAGQAPSVQGATQAGKVQVDPNAKFTHFQVGNSNVKSIFIDGKIAWVGTSGGVVRYDTSTDEYRMTLLLPTRK